MGGPRDDDALSRRELLVAGAALGASVAVGATPADATAPGRGWRLDFAALGPGGGWPGWAAPGVANLRRAGGLGLLEAGSDVFPNDPRPVAFAIDRRMLDGQVRAHLARLGSGPGVVVRRTGPRAYYAAVLAADTGTLSIVRRLGNELDVLARTVAPEALLRRLAGTLDGRVDLALRATGRHPTRLTARLDIAGAAPLVVTAEDDASALQAPGDPGVLSTAETLFPSAGPSVFPALGNVHLLPYGVQEGAGVLESPAGAAVLGTIRARSTTAFGEIVVTTTERPRVTAPSALATTTGAPVPGGAMLRVAADVGAEVRIELSSDAGFRRPRVLSAQRTDAFGATLVRAQDLRPGRTVHWRARLRRKGVETVGPARSFRVLPAAGSTDPARVAVASCAAQFGPIFDLLAARRPDVFVWQGDLNYPDTVGPLAQCTRGYAGIWREFLANPRLDGLLSRSCFAVQRDDHDYGVQDANAANLVPWGLAPWESLMEARTFYRFTAGLAEFWVLDQRRHKSPPEAPDTPDKTLLGARQRAWLLRTLAASRAPFKVVCSPCTLAPLPANARDGSWAVGYASERDLLLRHVATRVSGTTLFITGDTHWTMAYEADGLVEVRPCPLGIPTPNDITLTQPQAAEDARRARGVVYADDDRAHVAFVDVAGEGDEATLELTLVREDGATPYRRTFTARRPA